MINLGGQAVLGANAFTATQQIFAASGTSPDFEVWLNGDTFARAALGLNSSDGARVSFGGGSGARDVLIERAGAANLRFGGPDAASPVAQTLSVQNVLAGTSNTAGASVTVAASRGTGTAAGGNIVFQTAPAGLTGSTQNPLATVLTLYGIIGASAPKAIFAGPLGVGGGEPAGNIGLRVTGQGSTTTHTIYGTDNGGNVNIDILDNGSVLLGRTAPATNATVGFVYVPGCAGQPTGTPTTQAGYVPIQFDITNSQFWIYTGGAWKQPKTPAAAATITWQ